MQNMAVSVINLDRRPDRMAYMSAAAGTVRCAYAPEFPR